MKKEDIKKLEELNTILLRIENYQATTRTIQLTFIYLMWGFILLVGWLGTLYILGIWSNYIGIGAIIVGIIWWIFIIYSIKIIGIKYYMPYIENNVIIKDDNKEWKSQIIKYRRIQMFIWIAFIEIFVISFILLILFRIIILVYMSYIILILATFGIYIAGRNIFKNWKKIPSHLIIPILLVFLLPIMLEEMYYTNGLYLIFAICALYMGGELYGLYHYFKKDLDGGLGG